MMPNRQAPSMPDPNPVSATHPPTDTHAGDHAPGDIQFLFHMAGNLRASLALADQHRQEGQHPDVAALADSIAATHSTQLAQVDGLKARLSSPSAGAATSTGASSGTSGGHGAGGGYGAGAGDGGSGGRGAELRAGAKPYGDVTYADPGYQKDGQKRYPLDTAAHVRAAWSYINMPKNAGQYSASQLASIKGRIKAAARKLGVEISDSANSQGSAYEELRDITPLIGRAPGARWDADDELEQREATFEMAADSDGWNFEGYAAVFNSPTRIRDWEGDFEETIVPGAFRRTLAERPPVLMFEHGKHPLLGSLPLGVINHAGEDSRGLYIQARFTDNWLIQPVRDAVRDGGIRGMSFRFTVPKGGDAWSPRNDKRTVRDLDMPELGPVVFPAYRLTTARVRSALDCIDCNTGRPGAGSAGGGGSSDAQPGNGEASRARTALRVLDVHPLQSREHYRA